MRSLSSIDFASLGPHQGWGVRYCTPMVVRAAIVVVLCGFARAAVAAPADEPLRTVGEVRRLSPEEAAKGRPVRVRAVVTYYHHDWEMLFVQDPTGGIYVYLD